MEWRRSPVAPMASEPAFTRQHSVKALLVAVVSNRVSNRSASVDDDPGSPAWDRGESYSRHAGARAGLRVGPVLRSLTRPALHRRLRRLLQAREPVVRTRAGYSGKELTSRPFLELVHPNDVEGARAARSSIWPPARTSSASSPAWSASTARFAGSSKRARVAALGRPLRHLEGRDRPQRAGRGAGCAAAHGHDGLGLSRKTCGEARQCPPFDRRASPDDAFRLATRAGQAPSTP
jgi:hypothetical protein